MRFIVGKFTTFSTEIEFFPNLFLVLHFINQPLLLSLYQSSS